MLRDDSIAPLQAGEQISVEYFSALKWIYQHFQNSLPLSKEANGYRVVFDKD